MAEKNIVRNLEAKASDGNQIFTPRQWLERFRQFTKREHKIDITPLAKGEDITKTGWTAEKEAQKSPKKRSSARYPFKFLEKRHNRKS